MPKVIYTTGITGFIGRNLLIELLSSSLFGIERAGMNTGRPTNTKPIIAAIFLNMISDTIGVVIITVQETVRRKKMK